LVRRFTVEQQQVPKDLAELVPLKYLEAVPQAPVGQKFVIDRRKVEVLLEAADGHRTRRLAESNRSLDSGIVSKPNGATS
jgi:hypothetical protein